MFRVHAAVTNASFKRLNDTLNIIIIIIVIIIIILFAQ